LYNGRVKVKGRSFLTLPIRALKLVLYISNLSLHGTKSWLYMLGLALNTAHRKEAQLPILVMMDSGP
jgi:hypothetical protein